MTLGLLCPQALYVAGFTEVESVLQALATVAIGHAIQRPRSVEQVVVLSDLLTLPPGLLIQILVASDTFLDALHLSATYRLLNDVYLEHREPIIESILKSGIPAYDEAVELVLLKTRLEYTMDDPPTPSLRNFLPILLRNADLCASTCLAYSAVHPEATSPAASYYSLR
jgi:hypothetical protein